MKHLKKWICILCVLVTVILLSACTADNPGDVQNDTNTAAGSVNGLQLFEDDGTFRYTIIRSQDADQDIIACCSEFLTEMRRAFASDVSINDDFVERSATEEEVALRYEILIGHTNRPESAELLSSLNDDAYRIAVCGNKIIIGGKGDRGTMAAVQYFTEHYLQNGEPITADLDIQGTYEMHPLDYVLEDRSDGAVNPRLVETKYPTEDVVVAEIIVTEDGYAVDSSGRGNSTAGIQKALDDCARHGGGTVFLPAGTYSISEQIQIPAFVTLRGDWQDPDAENGAGNGTVIFVWGDGDDAYAADKEVTTGTFMLGGSGGVVGLTVYYPEQTLDAVKPYPFTFYTDGKGNNYMLSTVKNVTVINGYRGIGACCQTGGGAHEQLTVENFKGTFLHCGAEVYNQADVGTWQNVSIGNRYWTEAAGEGMVPADADALAQYTKKNAVGLKLGDLEWTEFGALYVSDCSIGIEIMVGKRIQFAGSLFDIAILGCERGMVINELDRRWGMVIANSTIENGIYNYSYRNNEESMPGMVKLCNVRTTGDLKGEILVQDAPEISALEIDYSRSYVKPNAVLYKADLDIGGTEDVSSALQTLLDTAGETGGVVYLPAGTYRLDHPITVPSGVELRGAAGTATREQGWMSKGTLLLSYYGDDADSRAEDQALITLAGEHSGINGIRILYPENGPYDASLHTTYTVRGTAKGVYLVNSMIAASSHGVDFSGCDDHFIKKVSTCCYENTFLVGGRNGVISGCLQNGTVLCRTNVKLLQNWIEEGNVFRDLFDPITRRNNRYIIADGADGETVFNTFVYGCANMLVCRDASVLAVNIGSDNIGDKTPQLVIESGEMTVINSMRYNGVSFSHEAGRAALYNRITIWDKTEAIYLEQKTAKQ